MDLFDEFLTSRKYTLEYQGQTQVLNQSQILAMSYDPDRNLRKAAQECFYTEISQHELVLSNIYNAIIQDHGLNDGIEPCKQCSSGK